MDTLLAGLWPPSTATQLIQISVHRIQIRDAAQVSARQVLPWGRFVCRLHPMRRRHCSVLSSLGKPVVGRLAIKGWALRIVPLDGRG